MPAARWLQRKATAPSTRQRSIDLRQPRQIPVLASQTGIPRRWQLASQHHQAEPYSQRVDGRRKRSRGSLRLTDTGRRRYIPCLTNMRLTPASIRVKTR